MDLVRIAIRWLGHQQASSVGYDTIDRLLWDAGLVVLQVSLVVSQRWSEWLLIHLHLIIGWSCEWLLLHRIVNHIGSQRWSEWLLPHLYFIVELSCKWLLLHRRDEASDSCCILISSLGGPTSDSCFIFIPSLSLAKIDALIRAEQ